MSRFTILTPHTGDSIEVFFADHWLAKSFGMHTGWFYWSCQRGYLPKEPPTGPFATSYAAYRNALGAGKLLFEKEALSEQSCAEGQPHGQSAPEARHAEPRKTNSHPKAAPQCGPANP